MMEAFLYKQSLGCYYGYCRAALDKHSASDSRRLLTAHYSGQCVSWRIKLTIQPKKHRWQVYQEKLYGGYRVLT